MQVTEISATVELRMDFTLTELREDQNNNSLKPNERHKLSNAEETPMRLPCCTAVEWLRCRQLLGEDSFSCFVSLKQAKPLYLLEPCLC